MKERKDGGYDIATCTTITKVVVTVVLVAWWLWMPAIGYMPVGEPTGTVAETIREHLLWPLSHANIWHLAGNLWVLWWLKDRLYPLESYVMAVVCSFLPVMPGLWDIFSQAEPVSTVGFSGVLCASIGIRWGIWAKSCLDRDVAYVTFTKRVFPFVVVGYFIPHVNWSIHLFCLIAGLAYGRWK